MCHVACMSWLWLLAVRFYKTRRRCCQLPRSSDRGPKDASTDDKAALVPAVTPLLRGHVIMRRAAERRNNASERRATPPCSALAPLVNFLAAAALLYLPQATGVAKWHALACAFYGIRLNAFLLYRELFLPPEVHQMSPRDATLSWS